MLTLCVAVSLLGPSEWTSQWRGDDFGRVNAIAVSAAGETLAVGEFATNLTISAGVDLASCDPELGPCGPASVTPKRLPARPGAGARVSALVRYGPRGELRAATPIGGEHFAAGVAATADGGALVVGAVSNPPEEEAEGAAPRGDADGFVARFDAAGQPQWLRRFAGRGEQVIRDVAALPGDRFAIAGSLSGEARFEGDPPRTLGAAGESDGFVAVVSGEGAIEWIQAISGAGRESIVAVAASPAGSIVAAGTCNDAARIRGRTRRLTLRCREAGAGLVAAWSGAGELLWAKATPGGARDAHEPADVVALADGGAVIVGAFQGRFGAAAGAPVSADPRFADGFVARVDGRGELRWTRHLRGPAIESVRGVALGPDGELWVWAHASADMDFGDGRSYVTRVPRGGENAVLLRYDAGGALRAAELVGGKPEPRGSAPVRGVDDATEVRPEAIAAAPDGSLRLAGSFSGAARLLAGEPLITAKGSLDGFVAATTPSQR